VVDQETVQEAVAAAAADVVLEAENENEPSIEDTLQQNDTAPIETYEQPKKIITQDEFIARLKEQKKLQQHEQRNAKARDLRRSQPFSNAKIEDLNDIMQMIQSRDNDIFVLAKTLYRLGLVKESDVQETRAYEQQRAVKFSELIAPDCSLTVEEKLVVATEWNLPLAPLGLEVATTE